MDCRTCQPTLIDLLHGELATDAAEDARAHLRQCSSCSGAYDRLAAGLRLGRTLEIEEPPAAVTARILETAEAHARATIARNAAARSARPGAWRSLLDFVSRFAMARQVGMVTITLLIVAVGLLSLPRRGRAPSAVPAVAGGTVLNPEVAEEAVPTGGVQPAERLPLKMDARSGRIMSKDQDAPATPSAQPSASAMAAAPAQAPTDAESNALAQAAPKKKAAGAPSRALDDLAAPAGDRSRQEGRPLDSALGNLGGQAAASAAHAKAARAAPANVATSVGAGPSAFPKNESGLDKSLTPYATSPQAAPPADKRSLAEFASASAPPPAAASPTAGAAAKPGSTSVRDCGPLATRYEQAMRADPTSLAAGQSMIALAECRAALGQAALARPLLERATQIAGVAARARALLSAGDEQARPASASAPAAEPMP